MSTPADTLLIRNAEVRGIPGLDLRVDAARIQDIGVRLARRPGEPVLDAAGGAVIPGLHDHHVHLRAAVAARQSTDVSHASDLAAFDRAITAAARAAKSSGRHWLRATGWDEHRAGPLDRNRLDALAGLVPARVQHRSGAMWVLNSAALNEVGADGSELPGVERAPDGHPTGRLLRLDAWLRERLPRERDSSAFTRDLAAFAAWCAARGVTGFTDATPDRRQGDIDEFGLLSAAGAIPQRLVLMAPPGLREPGTPLVTLGPQKVILDDETLPRPADLAAVIGDAHSHGSAVAVHCVTAEQLVVAVAAFEESAPGPSRRPAPDRIEHAAVVPPGYAAVLAERGLVVVTQPGFIADRGDSYRRHVSPAERDWLYPCATLLAAGAAVAAGTDAPFGPADPWRCVAAGASRRAPDGTVLGAQERVSPARSLRLFTAAAHDARQSRTVEAGQPGDVCVLHAPLDDALRRPADCTVRATIIGGRLVDVSSAEP